MSFRGFAVLLSVLALAGCGHTINASLCSSGAASPCTYDPDYGYRFDPARQPDRDTLIVLTFSGGGTRAAALAYGTLQALKDLRDPSGASLLDRVDVISSVSGGSVTAGWYALNGKDGLAPDADANRKLLDFLYADGMSALELRGLNPLALARYDVTNYQRSDVLAGYFADTLYGDATFDLVRRHYDEDKTRPFVILNATDLGHETRFPFTQNRFDWLCSDLGGLRLAYGVAASANFPIVFSPIGLKNYSGDCPLHGDARWTGDGPPVWLANYAKYEASDDGGEAAIPPLSDGLAELRTAREAKDYIAPAPNDAVLHLIDGGVVDNLGVQSTLALEDDPACSPGLYQRLRLPRPPAYAKIQKILYIVVNARSRSPAGIDDTVSPPDVITSIQRVIDTPIDNTILGVQNYLTAELQAIALPSGGQTFVPEAQSRKSDCWTKGRAVTAKTAAGTSGAASQRAIQTKIVTIDFEEIPNKACRDWYWQIGTSWSLQKSVIDELVALPRIILRRSSELHDFYGLMGDRLTFDATFPDGYEKVCAPHDHPAPGL